jgi:histidinol-phosphatase
VQSDLALAFELADLAAALSLPRFRRRDFSISSKPDGSVVTDIDVVIETALREKLALDRPDHMVLGEERGTSGSSIWCWYLDPIDGTSRFIDGDPKWMTLIALAQDERVVLGIVDLPALGERWWAARGHGAFHDGRRLSVSSRGHLGEAVVSDTWHQDLARGHDDHPLSVIAAHCAEIRPHLGHSFLAVAAGQADIAVQRGSAPWDYAPLKVILEEAGGRYTDFDGTDRIDTGDVVGTNGLLHEAVLDLLPRVGPAA